MDFDIKLLITDLDGTLTDSLYYVSSCKSNNDECIVSKSFHTRDFWAMNTIAKFGIIPHIVTTSTDSAGLNKVKVSGGVSVYISKNCFYNGYIYYHRNVKNKREYIEENILKNGLSWQNVAYIGDAENDLECLRAAKVAACPLDATQKILSLPDIISLQRGGNACVYEFCNYIARLMGVELE